MDHMIYLDNGATSFHKPPQVRRAVLRAMDTCANPGRGGYPAAMAATEQVYACRETAGKLFSCQPEQVVLTANCTHGLNLAIATLVQPGDRVLISGFEHNAVVRPLHALGARTVVAGRQLFDWADALSQWEAALKTRPKAAIFTHVSNVFGYVLPVAEMAELCRQYGVPFAMDAAQSAGMLPIDFEALGAEFIAMPGHKGLLGPQGTGLLLCRSTPKPLLSGGTGSNSRDAAMPDFLPDGAEAGTLNVPGIAGLEAGMRYVNRTGLERIFRREQREAQFCGTALKELGFTVFAGKHQSGTLSFMGRMDCQDLAAALAGQGICVRAGLHCAPLAHESAGTLETGTVRLSFGHDASRAQSMALLRAVTALR